jgi:hypothetical protein
MGKRTSARGSVFNFIIDELGSFAQPPKPQELKQVKDKNYPGMRYLPKGFSPFKKEEEPEKKVGDQANRIKVLQDLLPVFCASLDQIDNLEQWRKGTYPPLQNYTITPSQAWTVVKLVYSSSRYTHDRKLEIYDEQKTKSPGLAAELAKNTTLAIEANLD